MEDNYTFNVDIETQKSTTSVASLRKEVKDLKDQLLNLEVGTEDYNRVLQECADKTHTLKEMNEDLRASAADVGERLGNISKTLAGVSGGVQVVTSGLSLMGIEMGKDNELMKTLVSLMSMTQGFQAIDDGVKAFARLTRGTKMATIAQKGLNLAVKAFPAVAIGAAIGFVVSKLIDWANAADDAKQKQKELNDEILRQNQKQYEDDQNALLDEFLKGLARRRKELEADGKSRVEIERQVRQEVQGEYDRQAEILRDNNKKYKEYLEAKEQLKEFYAKREQERGLSRREELTLESNLESLDRGMDEASHKAVVASGAMTKLRDVITDLSLDIRILERNTKDASDGTAEGVKKLKKELDAVTNTERNFFSDIVNGWNLVEVDTKTGAETIIKTVDGLITRLQQAGLGGEADFFSGFMTVDKVKDVQTYLDMNIDQIEEFVQHADVLSDEIIGHLRTAQKEGVITMKELGDFWKSFIEGNEHVLQEFQDISSGYEAALADAAAPVEVIQAASLDNQKKYNELMIRVLDERIRWLNEFGTAEERAEISRYLAQKAALTKQTEIYAEYEAATEEFNNTIQKLRKEYAEKQDSFWEYMVQQSGNLQQKLREDELQAEINYWEELKNCATEGTEQYEAIVEKIAELTQELNDLKLDGLQTEWEKTNKVLSKAYSMIGDTMSQLAALYQAQTDEAIAQLQDQLNNGVISQKEYYEQSEDLKEKEFYRQQNFQVAQALMNGAAAIMQIWGAYGATWPVAAALSAAMATITGLQVATIKAQKYHRGAAPGSSNNSGNGENWINVAPAYQMNDGTNATTDRLDQISSNQTSQRVYILESDIQSSNRRVQVRESNTRF